MEDERGHLALRRGDLDLALDHGGSLPVANRVGRHAVLTSMTPSHHPRPRPHTMPAYFLGRPVTVYVERFRRRR